MIFLSIMHEIIGKISISALKHVFVVVMLTSEIFLFYKNSNQSTNNKVFSTNLKKMKMSLRVSRMMLHIVRYPANL